MIAGGQECEVPRRDKSVTPAVTYLGPHGFLLCSFPASTWALFSEWKPDLFRQPCARHYVRHHGVTLDTSTPEPLGGRHMSCLHAALRRNQIWARTSRPLSLSFAPTASPCQGPKSLGSSWTVDKQGKNSRKCIRDPPPSPFHSLPSCLVDTWLSQCGLGRLRKFPSRAPGSQERELPQAISVPGSPFKGFLDR